MLWEKPDRGAEIECAGGGTVLLGVAREGLIEKVALTRRCEGGGRAGRAEI